MYIVKIHFLFWCQCVCLSDGGDHCEMLIRVGKSMFFSLWFSFSFFFVQAYLPQIALLVFLALLPKLLLALSKAEGLPSQSQVVRAASGKYFYFIIFNVFLGVTVFGAVFANISSFKVLIAQKTLSVSKVVDLFGNKVPPVATYYITYVALK